MALKIERFVAWMLVPRGARKSASKRVCSEEDYSAPTTPVDHSAWDAVLKRHVTRATVDGIETTVVDYRSLVAGDRDLDRYLEVLSTVDLEACRSNDNELGALYINAYNCFAVHLIVRHMREHGVESIASIRDLSTRWSSVWKQAAGKIGNHSFSLDEIEHQCIRGQWADPSFHACIVCPSLHERIAIHVG